MDADGNIIDSEGNIIGVESSNKPFQLVNHKSGKLIEIPKNTTLNQDDWEMIEDDLLPFEITAILISLGGVALIGLSIAYLTTNSILVNLGTVFLNGLGTGPLLAFFITIPLLIGVVQILLALLFSGAAAFEKWKTVSIQDVIQHNLPNRLQKHVRRLPLHCTARTAYLLLMTIFLFIQIIASATALGLNDYIANETNKGSTGDESGLVRSLLDYSSAVFNECCYNQGWSKQGPIPPCPVGTSTYANCTITGPFSGLQNKLCTCYLTDSDTFQGYVDYVNKSGVCPLFKKGLVSIDPGQKIPGTSISIRNVIPPGIDRIPIIGDDETEYGCGVGFIRGYQWAIVEWSTDELRPMFVAALIISGVQLVFLCIGANFVCRFRHQRLGQEEIVMQEHQAPPEEIRSPQGFQLLFARDQAIKSPQIMLPKFRGRNGSSEKRPSGTNLGLIPSPHFLDYQKGVINSPEMMKLAASKHPLPQKEYNPNIDSVL